VFTGNFRRYLLGIIQGDHSPENVKYTENSLMVHGTPPQHSACYVLLISCPY